MTMKENPSNKYNMSLLLHIIPQPNWNEQSKFVLYHSLCSNLMSRLLYQNLNSGSPRLHTHNLTSPVCACCVAYQENQCANTCFSFSPSSATCRDAPTSVKNIWKKLIITFARVSLTCFCCLMPPGGMCYAKNYTGLHILQLAFPEVH